MLESIGESLWMFVPGKFGGPLVDPPDLGLGEPETILDA